MNTQTTQRTVALTLPEPRRTGPVARRKMLRALGAWGALWAVAVVVVLADLSTAATSFALGLAVPGGAFFYTTHWALGIVGVVAIVLAVVIWWAAGPVVLPPLVWVGSAALPLAVGTDDTSSAIGVLAVPPILVLAAIATQELRFRAQSRRGAEIRRRLSTTSFTISGAPAAPPVTESSPADLAALRYALDLALQPVDEFAGFTRIDQFREAALRYQLNSLGYALATAQFTRTPAFTGYLAEAQRNAVTKVLDKRVWRYWATENLWGNLRWNPDPVDRENIMLTGFLGVQVAMYSSLNDDRFTEPGALTFRWNDDRAYANDFTTLAESIHRNMLAADFTLYPCEPNWTYTVCNTFGLNTLLAHDRLRGTHFAEDVRDRLHNAYETEFLRPDGRIVGVRCERLGMSWNLWAGPAIALTTAFWLHAGLPELAQRAWWIVRDQEIRRTGDRVEFPVRVTSRLDAGNYRLGNESYGLNMIAMAAGEMGDEATAGAALAGLERAGNPVERNGVRRYDALSGLGNLYALQNRFNRANGLRDLIAFGAPEQWRTGPVLAAAAYPDVLVARAVTDGSALDLVLRPGNGPCRTTVRLDRLIPRREYTVVGATTDSLTATETGTATVEVDLDGRRELSIRPH